MNVENIINSLDLPEQNKNKLNKCFKEAEKPVRKRGRPKKIKPEIKPEIEPEIKPEKIIKIEDKGEKKPIKFIPTIKKKKPIKQITYFRLPPPEPAPKEIKPVVDNIVEKIEELGKIGKEKGAVHYLGISSVMTFGYINVIERFKGDCVPIYKDIFGEFQIGIVINTKRNRTSILQDPDEYKKFGEALKKCIDRNISVICIYLRLAFGTSYNGHANMLIYRPFERVVERFEPHGQQYGNSIEENKSINDQLTELFEVKLNDYTYGEVRFVPPIEVCPFRFGFQSLEGSLKGLNIEGGGFCGMWSLFIMEMVLNNPTKSTQDIIKEVFKITEFKADYLKDIIRGYVVGIEKMLNQIAKQLDKEGFAFQLEKILPQKEETFNLSTNKKVNDFILNIIFETEKEIKDKKEFKPLPEKKGKSDEEKEKEKLYDKLKILNKQEIIDLFENYLFVGKKLKGQASKERYITFIIKKVFGETKEEKERLMKILKEQLEKPKKEKPKKEKPKESDIMVKIKKLLSQIKKYDLVFLINQMNNDKTFTRLINPEVFVVEMLKQHIINQIRLDGVDEKYVLETIVEELNLEDKLKQMEGGNMCNINYLDYSYPRYYVEN